MILIDTSGLYAVLDGDDENHAAARNVWADLLTTEPPLLVTSYVLVETTAIAQHRFGLPAVRLLYTDIVLALEVHWMTEADHRHAQHALLAADRRKLSLVDCGSFYVMRTRMMTTAFAFDPHFREQGFDVLPAA